MKKRTGLTARVVVPTAVAVAILMMGCSGRANDPVTTGEPNAEKPNAEQGNSPDTLSIEHSHGASLEEQCATGDFAKDGPLAELCAELAITYFYKDFQDGGSDVFKPGCHRYYTQAGCPAGRGRVWANSGDKCLGRSVPKKFIGEWTNAQCHAAKPADSTKFDCEKECQKTGANTGICVTVKDFCASGIDSAKCECITF